MAMSPDSRVSANATTSTVTQTRRASAARRSRKRTAFAADAGLRATNRLQSIALRNATGPAPAIHARCRPTGSERHENHRRRNILGRAFRSTWAASPRRPASQLAVYEHGLARIVADQGLEGWGEAFGRASAATTMATLGHSTGAGYARQDARDIGGLRARLSKAFHGFGRNSSHVFALSGIRHRVVGYRRQGRGPAAVAPAGATRVTQLTSYASLLRYGEASMVAAACERATSRGYRDIKLHEITVPEVAAARRAIGPRHI